MSLPPINPDKSASGIAVDPRTQDRVVPESRRSDGSLRKELKIRPGFTPQEDMSRFRGSRQEQQDRNALPKGHILGWVAPTAPATRKTPASSSAMSKSAKKNEKRREKKREEKEKVIKDSWEDDDEDEPTSKKASNPSSKKDDSTDDASKAVGQDENIDDLASKIAETNLN